MTTFDDLVALWKSGNFPQTSLFVSEDTESALAMIKKFAAQVFAAETKVPLENNPDFQVIAKISNEDEVKKEITIDQIRKATDFLSKTAGISNTKILVIYQADLLNLNAANASLKMLEEPGNRSYIFLITHYQNAILETIKSRCAVFNLQNVIARRITDVATSNNHHFFLPKNTDELFKFASDLALKKNRETWNEYSIAALDLMSQMIKISSGVLHDDLPRQFDFRDYNAHYLIHQYNRIKQIIADTDEYELDKKQSSIIIYEIVNCS